MSEEVLQNAEKRREVKGKGGREIYTQLNVEFQRIARKYKKVFSEQHKEIEENNKMEKTRDHFKKIGNIKGIFHARVGMIQAEMVRT